MRYLSVLLACVLGGCGGTAGPCSSDPAACLDGGSDAGSTCEGQCAPALDIAPDVVLLWSGPQGTAPPDCPAGLVPFTGYLDTPPTTVDCAPCFCGPSEGSCKGPAAAYANTAPCPAEEPGAMTTPFDLPTDWDGTCVPGAASGIDSSIPLHAQLVSEPTECEPSFGSGMLTDVEGATRAEVCIGAVLPEGMCAGAGEMCLPPQAERFSTCVWLPPGVSACPAGWTGKHPYYDDRYACTCGCDAPVGESCTTTVTVYEDGACATPLGSAMVSLDFTEQCVDLAAGSTIGSTSATPLVYQSGTCAPILTKSAVNTLCCLP